MTLLDADLLSADDVLDTGQTYTLRLENLASLTSPSRQADLGFAPVVVGSMPVTGTNDDCAHGEFDDVEFPEVGADDAFTLDRNMLRCTGVSTKTKKRHKDKDKEGTVLGNHNSGQSQDKGTSLKHCR